MRGRINISNDELDDLVIARGDGMPTYNFAVVVDDIDMKITHVIRGDDHVNNTPRQVNIFKALGAPLPLFAHVPMIVGQDGQRLSKRHGAVSVLEYRNQGFLPEAMRNYLLRLGWSHGDQEIFSTQEMIDATKLLARTEGILVDPVYTGKAFAGTIDRIKQGDFSGKQAVIFLQTGGSPAIFAYQDDYALDYSFSDNR